MLIAAAAADTALIMPATLAGLSNDRRSGDEWLVLRPALSERLNSPPPPSRDKRQLPYGTCAPTVFTYMAYIDVLAVINKRFFFFPPKHRLAQLSGKWILAIRSPLGA